MAARTADKAPWLETGDDKCRAVRRMFDQIAPVYDLLNGVMSLNLHHRWRRFAVGLLCLRPGDRALDVCCGTGDFLPPLRRAVGPQGELLGVDFSAAMLGFAPSKDAAAALTTGDACALPVASSWFDAVTVGWGIRNVPDIDLAHREAFRVLRRGGRFVSLDCAMPRNPLARLAARAAGRVLLPALGRLFGRATAYTYLPESTARFWDRERLASSMREAGFVDVAWRDLFGGNICVHFGRKA
jgi:demethylmenaquinone methyltransferase/2-methoxy-6-polyprenyl-1,4-benzoquinol methylase